MSELFQLTNSDPRNKDAIIETYLSCLEEKLLDIEIPSKRYNNFTKEEHNALNSFRDDSTTVSLQRVLTKVPLWLSGIEKTI